MDHRNSLGDRAVAIASALALLFAAAFGAEPEPATNPPRGITAAHHAAR